MVSIKQIGGHWGASNSRLVSKGMSVAGGGGQSTSISTQMHRVGEGWPNVSLLCGVGQALGRSQKCW